MYNQGVPEKLIAEKPGYRSMEALREYEHTASELQRAASEVIADPSKTFSTLMHKQELVEISPCIPVSSHGLPTCPLPEFFWLQ